MEPMTTQLVSELMPQLHAAFPRNLGQGNPVMMIEVYRNGLRGLGGDAVRAAVALAIQEDTYFPKVARLRELAMEWQRRNNAVIKAEAPETPWNRCAVCGAEARSIKITRIVRDLEPTHKYVPVLDAEGKPQWEEVESTLDYMLHDPVKHRVYSEAVGR